MTLRPMSEFDPSRPATVHDSLNDRMIEWQPEWVWSFRKHRAHADGVIEWDGLLLDGWQKIENAAPAG